MSSIVLERNDKMNEIVKKYYRKHWKLISIQIEALSDVNNPKRGFLFDCTSVDETKLKSMMAHLRNEHFVANDIIIVLVNSDFFIVNKSKFHEIIFTIILIDISGNLNEPKIHNSNDESTQKILNNIKNVILNHENEDILKIEANDDDSPPTIFGFLINYPILYYHKHAHEENCLSHKNLKVFQVMACNQLLMSFSVPESLFNQCENIGKSIEAYLGYYENSEKYAVESFISNYPSIIL